MEDLHCTVPFLQWFLKDSVQNRIFFQIITCVSLKEIQTNQKSVFLLILIFRALILTAVYTCWKRSMNVMPILIVFLGLVVSVIKAKQLPCLSDDKCTNTTFCTTSNGCIDRLPRGSVCTRTRMCAEGWCRKIFDIYGPFKCRRKWIMYLYYTFAVVFILFCIFVSWWRVLHTN